MTRPTPPWLDPRPPWEEPPPESLCAEAGLTRDAVPVVRLLSVPSNIPELVALRAERFVPLYGEGATRAEATRALANLVLALGERADVRGADHALALSTHKSLGVRPLELLAHAVRDGQAPALYAEIAIAYSSLLGASDLQRESVARLFEHSTDAAHEARLAITMGGGDYSAWREHYESLRKLPSSPAVRVARLWFEWVLARRFSALDQLHAMVGEAELDPASVWLAESAFFVQGEDHSRERLVSQAERVMTPVAKVIPRVMAACARDLVEGVRTPLSLRWKHLRAAAAKDHAAAAIRHWLAAATAQLDDDDESSGEALSPEPSRAATEARTAAGEFLLDWFVGDRDAREDVDAYARRIVRVYHRLRGAQVFARAMRELAPSAPSTPEEQLLWGKGAKR
ncbi:MAG: hypothetical protein JNK05_35755 [Myxococcales bacterium]|nr:hypothetical protein [Myxococcales bacterium]